MTTNCADLRKCAELLHEAAEARMSAAQQGGRHRLGYVRELQCVAAIEEAAAAVEAKVAEEC